MARIKLLGQELPLCLTVAAVERLGEKGLRLGDLDQLYTTGEGRDIQDCMDNSLWLLGVLLEEGRVNASLTGQPEAEPPTPEMLRHLLTPGRVLHEVIPAVMAAVNEGLSRTVEADHAKNGGDAAEEP